LKKLDRLPPYVSIGFFPGLIQSLSAKQQSKSLDNHWLYELVH
jgi:hypothetical protein